MLAFRLLKASWLYGPPIAYAALIFWLSSAPLSAPLPAGDKTIHVVAYFGLGALLARALYFGTGWTPGHVFTASAWVATLYGISDEWHQSFVPGRTSAVDDLLADALGAFLGAALTVALFEALHIWASRRAARFTARFVRGSASE